MVIFVLSESAVSVLFMFDIMDMEKPKHSYLIVEFPQESGEDGSIPTAIVSSSWAFEDSTDSKLCCWWPNFKSDEQRKKAVIQHKEIDVENCVPCEINIKYKTDVYQKAVFKLKQLEKDSDINTEDEKRPRRGVQKYSDFTSGSDSPSLSPPTPPAKRKPNETQINDVQISNVSTLCTSCETVEVMCARILSVVEKNSRKIGNLTQIVNASITEKLDGNQLPTLVELNNLPLKTEEDINDMDQNLSNREEYLKMLNALRFVGGKDVFDTTRRIMSRIITNNLALKVNWTGRNGKPAFKNYSNILSLLSELIRGNPLSANATEKEIFGVVKAWLRGAIDREGGRGKRKNNSTE